MGFKILKFITCLLVASLLTGFTFSDNSGSLDLHKSSHHDLEEYGHDNDHDETQSDCHEVFSHCHLHCLFILPNLKNNLQADKTSIIHFSDYKNTILKGFVSQLLRPPLVST